MNRGVLYAARLARGAQRAYQRKWIFLGLFVLTYGASFGALARLDLLPQAPVAGVAAAEVADLSTTASDTTLVAPEFPVKITIAKIGLSASVANPASTDVPTLDGALLKGAVRYPTSAELGQDGNVVLFGHSSYLPIVYNQAYKTFDGIQKLVAGDRIIVYSSTRVYTYAVQSVTKENADSASIPLTVSGRVLTLSTCDSFATKSDRFIVTATFVGSEVISS